MDGGGTGGWEGSRPQSTPLLFWWQVKSRLIKAHWGLRVTKLLTGLHKNVLNGGGGGFLIASVDDPRGTETSLPLCRRLWRYIAFRGGVEF